MSYTTDWRKCKHRRLRQIDWLKEEEANTAPPTAPIGTESVICTSGRQPISAIARLL